MAIFVIEVLLTLAGVGAILYGFVTAEMAVQATQMNTMAIALFALALLLEVGRNLARLDALVTEIDRNQMEWRRQDRAARND